MKKILILNFTRIGDLIQTSPLIAGLKEKYPKSEITLLANVSFVGICDHIPNIDRLLVFDVKQFVNADDGNTSILDVYRYLDKLTAELQAENYDVLINLSHSRLTAMMGRLLGIDDVRGFYATEDGYRVVNDPWIVYFSSLLSFRIHNTFNLVDLYQLSGGVLPKGRGLLIEKEKPVKAASKMLSEIGISDGDTVIGVQAGASRTDRRWAPEKFAAAADLLSKRKKAKVLLFGAPSEKELGDEIASRMKGPAINLVGKTSLEELIGVVDRCEMLLTNDTATMHVAAAVGTPSIALFLVHAFPPETGPYSEGNIILEPQIACFPCSHHTKCPHYACLDMITPEDVAEAAEILPELKKNKGFFVDAAKFPEMRILSSYFDEAGFLDLRPLMKLPLREVDIMSRLYRYFFIQPFLKNPSNDYWIKPLSENFEQWPVDETGNWAAKKGKVFDGLAGLARESSKLAASMQAAYGKGKVARVKDDAQKLAELDQKLITYGHAHKETMPITRLFEMGKENLPEGDLNVMFAQTQVLYTGIISAAEFMSKMLEEWAANNPAGLGALAGGSRA
ncbi:MAG: glycosyltransferase family 9 protein [Nitrospinota bacterium]